MNEFKALPSRAKEADLKLWSGVSSKARYDYDTDTFFLEEMLNNDFFGYCTSLLRKGDQITITDVEDQIMVVRVDEVLKAEKQVWLSAVERKYALPVATARVGVTSDPGLVYRWRALRGGGHAIITKDALVVAVNFGSREEALQTIETMYRENNFNPPHGHDPASVVRGASIYRPPVEVKSSVRSDSNREHSNVPSGRQVDQ